MQALVTPPIILPTDEIIFVIIILNNKMERVAITATAAKVTDIDKPTPILAIRGPI
jgi:hypothetical protein